MIGRKEYEQLTRLYNEGNLTKEDYENLVCDFLKGQENGKYGCCGKVLDDFCNYLIKNGRSDDTARKYVKKVESLIKIKNGLAKEDDIYNVSFEPITAKDVNNIIVQYFNNNIVKATMLQTISIFNMFNEYCFINKIPSYDKKDIIFVSNKERERNKEYISYFTDKEVENLIKESERLATRLDATMADKSVPVILSLAWEFMMNREALQELKIESFNREDKMLYFVERGTKQRVKLSENTARILQSYMYELKEAIPTWKRYGTQEFRNEQEDNLLFQTKVTEKVSYTSIFDRIRKFAKLYYETKEEQDRLTLTNIISSKKIYLFHQGLTPEQVNIQARVNDNYVKRFVKMVATVYSDDKK